MKIEHVAGPTILPAGPSASKAAEARARAIAKLTPNQSQPAPVQNANQVSPEEFGALRTKAMETGQNHINEASAPVEQQAAPEAVTQEEAAPSEPLSSQYAVLARKEKAQRMKEQQLRQREAELRAREEALRAPKAPESPSFDSSKYVSIDDLKKDPFAHLTKAGLTYEQLVEQAANAPTPEQVAQQNYLRQLEEKIAKLEEDQKGVKKTFEEREAESYKQAVAQIRNDVRSLVSSDPEYSTIKATNSVSDVVELIEETFKRDGILLSVEEAAAEVENYLVDEALKLSRLEKIQKRLASSSSATNKQSLASQSNAPKSPAPMKTLTNAVSSVGQLSPRERAILAFKGQQK